MNKRIEKLTEEQQQELPAFRERWRGVGLSTRAVDADTARASVRALYRDGGAKEPAAVIVLASPMACLIARAICEKLIREDLSNNQRAVLEKKLRDQLWDQLRDQLGGQLRDQLRDQLWGQIRDQLGGQLGGRLRGQLRDQLWGQLWDQLWGQIRDQLGDQLGGQIRDQLRDQLWDQLRGQIRGQIRDQLWGQLRDQLWGQLRDQLGDQLGGQIRDQLLQETFFIGGQDAFWLAFYEFGERIGGRFGETTKKHFEAYKAYALNCGWLYPYKSIAFTSDRPAEIHFDAARRLHAENGMAVRFRDGWGVHAWHGLRVPPRIIETSFSADTIEKEANAEFRRVLLERSYGGRSGFELYAEQRQSKVIAEDELHGQPRKLIEINVAGQPLRIIEVINGSLEPDGTRRKFHLGAVRPDRRGDLPKTPHEAVAASYGIAAKHYREAVRS